MALLRNFISVLVFCSWNTAIKVRLVNFFRLLCGIFLAPLKRLLFENQLECYPEWAFFSFMRRYRNYLEQCARADHQEDTVGSRGTLFDIEKKGMHLSLDFIFSEDVSLDKTVLFRFQNYFPVSCKRVNALVLDNHLRYKHVSGMAPKGRNL